MAKLGVMKKKFKVAMEEGAPIVMAAVNARENTELNFQMKLKVDTGADINIIGEGWIPMFTSIGVELVIDAGRIDIGWVNDSMFKVTSEVSLHVVLTGTKLLHEQDLRCKSSKCEIGVNEIVLLGHVVSAGGIGIGLRLAKTNQRCDRMDC